MQGLVGAERLEELLSAVAGLVPTAYDTKEFTYVASGDGVGEVETITYYVGGSGGSIVATITFTYDAQGRITLAQRS